MNTNVLFSICQNFRKNCDNRTATNFASIFSKILANSECFWVSMRIRNLIENDRDLTFFNKNCLSMKKLTTFLSQIYPHIFYRFLKSHEPWRSMRDLLYLHPGLLHDIKMKKIEITLIYHSKKKKKGPLRMPIFQRNIHQSSDKILRSCLVCSAGGSRWVG